MAQLILGGSFLGLYGLINLKSIMETSRNRTARYGALVSVYSVAAIAIFISVNAISAWENRKIADLTEGQFLSLSKYSIGLLKSLEKDLYITGFFVGEPISKDRNTLGLYENESSKVHLEIINPDKRPDITEEKGIKRAPTILIEYGKNQTKISAITEAAITNGIRRVIDPTPRVIYFTEGHGEPRLNTKPEEDMVGLSKAVKALENENFIPKPLNLMTHGAIPKDATLVVVPGAEVAFNPEEIRILSEYLDKGGRAIIMFDPVASSGLEALANKWGAVVGNDIVLDKVPYIGGMRMDKLISVNSYSKKHPVTRDMDRRHVSRYLMPRSISPKEYPDKGLRVDGIIFSRPDLSWAETNVIKVLTEGVAATEPEQGDRVGPICIATAASLDVASVLENTAGFRSVQTRVIVTGGRHFVNNQLFDEARNFNPDLFLNMVEWASGSEIIYAIRPKVAKIAYVDISPEERRTIFYMSVVLFPELLLIIGLGIWWSRR